MSSGKACVYTVLLFDCECLSVCVLYIMQTTFGFNSICTVRPSELMLPKVVVPADQQVRE